METSDFQGKSINCGETCFCYVNRFGTVVLHSFASVVPVESLINVTIYDMVPVKPNPTLFVAFDDDFDDSEYLSHTYVAINDY